MAKEKNWRDKFAKCPYYQGEDSIRHTIRCEGLGDAAYIEWGFGNRERERRRQMEVYCQDIRTCERCEMYRMIRESKYD